MTPRARSKTNLLSQYSGASNQSMGGLRRSAARRPCSGRSVGLGEIQGDVQVPFRPVPETAVCIEPPKKGPAMRSKLLASAVAASALAGGATFGVAGIAGAQSGDDRPPAEAGRPGGHRPKLDAAAQ